MLHHFSPFLASVSERRWQKLDPPTSYRAPISAVWQAMLCHRRRYHTRSIQDLKISHLFVVWILVACRGPVLFYLTANSLVTLR